MKAAEPSYGLTLFCALLVLLLVFCAAPACCQSYVTVSAELEIIYTNQAPKSTQAPSAKKRTVPFTCTFGLTEWQLDGQFSINGTHGWSFDGTNVCQRIQATSLPQLPEFTNEAAPATLRESLASNITVHIYTTPGGYPPGEVSVNVPWLAFCSGSYLRREGRTIPLPTAILGHSPDAFGYADRTATFTDELGLPRMVELFTSKALLQASVSNFSKKSIKEYSLPRKYPDNLRKFSYRVLQVTNIHGWSIPMRFQFEEELPDYFSHRLIRGEGRVLSIAEALGPAGVFKPELRQTVVDWRFHHPTKEVNAIKYHWTNSSPAPTNNRFLQENFAKHAKSAPYTLAIRKARTRILIIALFIVAAIPPLLAFRRAARTRRNNSSKH